MTYNYLKVLMEIDSNLFEKCSMECHIDEENNDEIEKEKNQKWASLEQKIKEDPMKKRYFEHISKWDLLDRQDRMKAKPLPQTNLYE
jgi:hypothetical protein